MIPTGTPEVLNAYGNIAGFVLTTFLIIGAIWGSYWAVKKRIKESNDEADAHITQLAQDAQTSDHSNEYMTENRKQHKEIMDKLDEWE